MHGGTVVDATIVAAPSSTKNQSGERDPEMHQTKKGNEWHYGMKIHSGLDADSSYVHTITATSANEHDITETAKLIRKDDAVVYGDSGYLGIEKREDIKSDNNLRQVDFRINKRPSQNKITAHYKVPIGTNRLKTASHRPVAK
jgi:IS5 family transposase